MRKGLNKYKRREQEYRDMKLERRHEILTEHCAGRVIALFEAHSLSELQQEYKLVELVPLKSWHALKALHDAAIPPMNLDLPLAALSQEYPALQES